MHMLLIISALAIAVRTLFGWDVPVNKKRIFPAKRARITTIFLGVLIAILFKINYEPNLNMEAGGAFLYLVVFAIVGVSLSRPVSHGK